MVKVLIYSSKHIYDTSSYEGRAEADIIAYSLDDYYYEVVKVKYPNYYVWGTGKFIKHFVKHWIEEREKKPM
jgi:hypothetical protein